MPGKKKWRFVIERSNPAEWYAGWIPAEIMAMNEGIIPDTVSFFYMDTPGLYLQHYCDALVDIDYEECKRNNIPVVRAIACGGGVGYTECGTEPYLLMIWDVRRHPEIPTDSLPFYATVLSRGADIMSEKYEIPVRFRALNDVEIWDPRMKMWRKSMGVGFTGMGNAQMFAWFPWVLKESDLPSKLVTPPKEKFADKAVKELGLRAWSFEEAGAFKGRAKPPTRDELVNEWIQITLEALKRAYNIEAEAGEFSDKERAYVKQLYELGSSEEYILARSAEKRFETIPEGTALGKYITKVTGGPLLRAYVLRRGNTIEDIMFAGTMHMSPADALEHVEDELKGYKIDENLIRTKVEQLFAKENVIIGLGSASLVSGTVIQACRESYE